ncbi:hypothetical protein [Lentzea flaviverrucosa]|uniref:hypothetical protein n=1 Tax=Lentzea flaviverrucosa TaxID=200379 RepID=UPI00116045C3|nr:hypothetical protein [Lentzea flaviverrucosa]
MSKFSQRFTAAVMVAVVSLLAAPFGTPSAAAALNERHFVRIDGGGFIVDHSVEIWNQNSGTRVWRSEGPTLSGFEPKFTYTYTYRGGPEYLRFQYRIKGVTSGGTGDVRLNIRCDTQISIPAFQGKINFRQFDCK